MLPPTLQTLPHPAKGSPPSLEIITPPIPGSQDTPPLTAYHFWVGTRQGHTGRLSFGRHPNHPSGGETYGPHDPIPHVADLVKPLSPLPTEDPGPGHGRHRRGSPGRLVSRGRPPGGPAGHSAG